MKATFLFTLIPALMLFASTLTSAATYYVDFAGGDNKANGTSAKTAWKHSPGDANATDAPAALKLQPGDTVIFKGGVAYHGSLSVTASGKADQHITLDGNSAGTFGEGKAILDGGRVIEGWKRCASAEEAGGNPFWKKIYYADIDVNLTPNANHGTFVVHRQQPRDKQAPWQRIILSDGDRSLLPISQFPKPTDAFYPDLPGDFLSSPVKLDVRKDENLSIITDEKNLTAKDANAYDGMFVGVHGGNNHVYFGAIKGYDPAKNQLIVPLFTPSTYPATKYALYNSVKLIDKPGEWAVVATNDKQSRVYLLPERLVKDQPENIGFPDFATGISIDKSASYVSVKNFRIQRFSGGGGAVSISQAQPRSNNINISDCEIRFVSGHAGIGLNHCDQVVVENCYIYQCPAWTTAIFVNRVSDYVVRNNFLRKNSGSGIRHYEAKKGELRDNVVLDHFGMHSSGINVYEGCADLVIEGNYIENTVAINRNAENIVFRNNVFDAGNKSPVNVAMWSSGTVGGREIKNIQFLNNTFVNNSHQANYATGIFGQGGAGTPEGLIVRGNIMDRLTSNLKGEFENNLFLRDTKKPFLDEKSQVVSNPEKLFRDPARQDYRRAPGGPAMDVGASVPPPPEKPKGY